MLTDSQIYQVARILEKGHYGSFMAAIGEALQLADSVNQQRLISAFGDTFERVYNSSFAPTSDKLISALESLTLAQAKHWESITDKWVYIDDTILAPVGLRATDNTVGAVEDAFDILLTNQ